MVSVDQISGLGDAIRRLYEIVDSLETGYSKYERHFTLDGHLLGSIGEVYVAKRYNVRLLTSSAKGHDGITNDGRERLVQIKVTQERARKKAIGLSSEPEWLIVLQVSDRGKFSEVYNGRGEAVWNLVKDKPMPQNGQRQVTLGTLRELNQSVPDVDRIERQVVED